MPITMMNRGTEVTILKFLLKDNEKKHMENLGILTGSRVKILSKLGGDTILLAKGVRIAINNEQARKLIVKIT